MDVLEAIRSRRTVKSFRPDPVPRALIEQVLEAAVWAPNHHLTEPWRFTVVQGAMLERLADLRRSLTVAALETQQPPRAPEQIAREGAAAYAKALAAPVTVVVALHQADDAVVREEDYGAGAAAIQTMMLAAHALGLAAFWSTNRLIAAPETYALLGIPPEQRIIGLVQLGYPDQTPARRRTPAAALTRWLS